MQPEPLARADLRDARHGVDRGRRRRAHRGHDRDRPDAGGTTGRDRGLERAGVHAERGVRRDPAHAGQAQPQGDDRLVDAGMGILRAIDAQRREVRPPRHPGLADAQVRVRFARGGQRVQGTGRRGIVDHALETGG